HEIAAACGIPGKIGPQGGSVVDFWLAGDMRRIVQYNECDALTTYLLWLRTAHFAGFVTDEGYESEQAQLEQLLQQRAQDPANDHLSVYLSKWRDLRQSRQASSAMFSSPGESHHGESQDED